MEKEIKVGSIVESKCTKCKLVLDHIVVSMKGKTIDKVECNTCKSQHKYRDPNKPKVTRTSKRKRTVTRKSAAANEKDWEKMMADVQEKDLIPYSLDKSFKEGDKIAHTTFGNGGVIKILGPTKISVHFKKGSKILVCNMKK